MIKTETVQAALVPILPEVARHREAAEQQRRPSREVMVKLGQAGLMRLMVPEEYGGHGAHPRTFIEFTETLAQVHASLGWTAMTCNEEAGITSAYLDPRSVTDFFAANPSAVVAGSGVAKGRTTKVDGGWLVSGRWPFVSGCTASDWLVVTSIVRPAESVSPTPTPHLCFTLVPTSEVTIEDTWHTVGLRGTGSNDAVLDDHFVPDEFASGSIASPPRARPDTAFYRLPPGLRFPFPKVGVAAGITRAAIDEFIALAEGKRPLYSGSELRQRPGAQAAVASAEALLGSGRSWALDVVEELWEVAESGEPVPPELHARCRLACSHAVTSCIEAVEGLVAESGSTANFAESPLSRHVNDVRAVAGHFMVAPARKQTAGRVLLGLEPDDAGF